MDINYKKPKKYKKYKEKYKGLATGMCFTFICFFFIKLKAEYFITYIQNFSSLGLCIFGFLLTFLAIIIQGNGKMIDWLMSNTILYQRFINFNKQVVIISLATSLYSYIMLGFINYNEYIMNSTIIKLLTSIFVGLVIWLFIDLYTFIKIFYLLIKK